MSLVIPAIGLAYTTYLMAKNKTEQQKKMEEVNDVVVKKHKRPDHGTYQPFSKTVSGLELDPSQIKQVTQTVDIRGVPIFLVDFSDGSRTSLYAPPEFLL